MRLLWPCVREATANARGARLKSFQSVQEQRERECTKWDKPTMDAVHWMRNNVDKFRGKVYEPVRLCVTAKDKKFVNLAEGPISVGAFRVRPLNLFPRAWTLLTWAVRSLSCSSIRRTTTS